jgi:hypothetical protein
LKGRRPAHGRDNCPPIPRVDEAGGKQRMLQLELGKHGTCQSFADR